MKYVNAPVMKKDAMALVTGKPVYTDDVAPKDCLIVKVLRSPHAHALIEEINITNALKQKGIECILTYKDVPHRRFTMAGQTFPEPCPYDRYILDQRVRFVGDAVAIVAGEDPFLAAVTPLLDSDAFGWTYRELDPDVFGEELEKPGYERVERIAVVALTVTRLR